jgi:hypothetical protein
MSFAEVPTPLPDLFLARLLKVPGPTGAPEASLARVRGRDGPVEL